MDEDPVFYQRFSEMIKRAIQAYRDGVLQSAEYLRQVTDQMNAVLNRTGDDLPAVLDGENVAKAYYGIVNQEVQEALGKEKAKATEIALAEAAIKIDHIIDQYRIVKWTDNIDVQNRMKMVIEDHLFEMQEDLGIDLDFDTIDRILDGTIEIAKVRKP
jgi:type I restriction enzyme R subunit